MHIYAITLQSAIVALLLFGWTPAAMAADDNAYMDMSLEDLLSVEVSSVSRKQELLRNAGAAIFVISAEDIRRSGATSIPETLRMVPGMNVARINANEWAVSSRGFNGRFANKLLVQIDGRSVYTPSFSGVYWDDQDTILEDIERIEVIRGPGATLWGSNAVNGIINIITKQSIDAQGGLLVAGGGSFEQGFGSLRYGGELENLGYGRAYLKYHKQANARDFLTNARAGDSWKSLRGGFRIDSDLDNNDSLTLQGDIYHNRENQLIAQLWQAAPPYRTSVADNFSTSGWNTLARWEHQLSGDDATTLQLYYDYNKRDEVFVGQQHQTLDVDFQHRFGLGDWQQIIWGAGYRHLREHVRGTFAVALPSGAPANTLVSGFIQDDIKLGSEALHLVPGSKFERNDFTGWEIQPSARLIWTASETQTLWTAISRAARTPSRVEIYGQAVVGVVPPVPPIPAIPVTVVGNPAMQAEKLTAYELGYRFQPTDSLNIDLAAFYNDYHQLRTFEANPVNPTIITMGNNLKGHTYGVELAADWQALDWWQLRLAYSNLNIKLQLQGASTDT
ncbi:MAG: TonB-dependent receptor, partial [Mariprofundus sp.]